MSARLQGSGQVEIVSPKDTVLRCAFPFGFRLHDCVQNVVHLQVQEDQIIQVRYSSDVLNDILHGLQVIHRETALITFGKVERRLLELHVCSAELLDRALASIIGAIYGNQLRATYKNYHMKPAASFA